MKFQILHTNDMHNHFPAELLSRLREPGGLVLDSGDAIAGSNTVFRAREPILEKMSDFGYQAMCLGNREFHYLRGVLSRRFRAARFPILSANVVDLRKELKIVDSTIVSLGDLKIGLFGLTVPQYPIGSFWEMMTGWRFFDPKDVVLEIPGRLRKAGASLVFCLSHLGFPVDKRIAELGGIDLILGGHSHTVLSEVSRVGKTAILQTGSHGRFVGNWHLEAQMTDGRLNTWTLEGELVPNDRLLVRQ